MRQIATIFRLGIKEFWSLLRDPIMLVLIVYVFSIAVYTSATAMPETLNNAPIAIVDEDDSPLSARITSAFYPPQFVKPTTPLYWSFPPTSSVTYWPDARPTSSSISTPPA